MSSTLEVVEVFFTLQGEGVSLGHPSVFLRLRRCNLQCKWSDGSICDTWYTWKKDTLDYQRYRSMTVEAVSEELKHLAGGVAEVLVISGGEPLLWQRQLTQLLGLLNGSRFARVEVETNGTIVQKLSPPFDVRFNVSPKLSSAGNRGLATQVPKALVEFARLSREDRAAFKFVVQPETWQQDFREVEQLQEMYTFSNVYIMPEGTTTERILYGLRTLVEPCKARGWRLTPRLHILLWGNERAR